MSTWSHIDHAQDETLRAVHDLATQTRRLGALIATLENEERALTERVAHLCDALQKQESTEAELTCREHDAEPRDPDLLARFGELERQNAELMKLYVATQQLRVGTDHLEVLAAIQDIVANLIGCEEMAVFEPCTGGDALEAVVSVGVEAGALPAVRPGAGLIGRAIVSGERWVQGTRDGALPHEEDLTACVPLVMDGEVLGVVAMYALLPQKPGEYERVDLALMDVLANQAAGALRWALATPERRRQP